MTGHSVKIGSDIEPDDEVATTVEEVPVDQYDPAADGDDSTPPEDRT